MDFKLINTTIIKSSKIWIWITGWFIFFIVLLIINYFYLNQNRYLILCCITCIIAPLIFFDKILKTKYSEKIKIRLDYELWSFFIIRNGVEKKYKLSEILYYRITESTNGYTSRIAFRLKLNAKTINITMYNQTQSPDETKTEEILEAFQSMINNYDKSVGDNGKIIFKKTFEESVYGLVSIYVLSGMIILAIILHIVLGRIDTLPLSLFFGGAILIGIIAVRQRDIKRRKKGSK